LGSSKELPLQVIVPSLIKHFNQGAWKELSIDEKKKMTELSSVKNFASQSKKSKARFPRNFRTTAETEILIDKDNSRHSSQDSSDQNLKNENITSIIDFKNFSINKIAEKTEVATIPTETITSIMIPSSMFKAFAQSSKLKSLRSLIGQLELLSKDAHYDKSSEDIDKIHHSISTKILSTFLNLWKTSPRDVNLLLASLSNLRKVRLSFVQLSNSSTSSYLSSIWECTLVSTPSALDMPTVQILRTLVSLDVHPLSALLTYTPRSLFGLGRCTSLHLASSPLGPLCEHLFKGACRVNGCNALGGSKRGWSEGRVHPNMKKRWRIIQNEEFPYVGAWQRNYTVQVSQASYHSFPQSSVRNLLGVPLLLGIERLAIYGKHNDHTLVGITTPRSSISHEASLQNRTSEKVESIPPPRGSSQNLVKQLPKSSRFQMKHKKSFMMTGFIEDTQDVHDKLHNGRSRRSISEPPPVVKALEKARISSISRLMSHTAIFPELKNIFVKTIKTISACIHMRMDANYSVKEFQPLPTFQVYDSTSPFYNTKPYLAHHPSDNLKSNRRSGKTREDPLPRFRKLTLNTQEMPKIYFISDQEQEHKEASPILQGMPSFREKEQEATEDKVAGYIERDFATSERDNNYKNKDMNAENNGSTSYVSDSKGLTEIRETKVLKSLINRPKSLKSYSICWNATLIGAFLISLFGRMYMDTENTNVMAVSLEQNEEVLLLTLILNPISVLYKELIKEQMLTDAGVPFNMQAENLYIALIYATHFREFAPDFTSNYTDVKSRYFMDPGEGKSWFT
jgi:hypothetical protein